MITNCQITIFQNTKLIKPNHPHHHPHHTVTRRTVPLEPFQLKTKLIQLIQLKFISQRMHHMTYKVVLDQ